MYVCACVFVCISVYACVKVCSGACGVLLYCIVLITATPPRGVHVGARPGPGELTADSATGPGELTATV